MHHNWVVHMYVVLLQMQPDLRTNPATVSTNYQLLAQCARLVIDQLLIIAGIIHLFNTNICR